MEQFYKIATLGAVLSSMFMLPQWTKITLTLKVKLSNWGHFFTVFNKSVPTL